MTWSANVGKGEDWTVMFNGQGVISIEWQVDR